jgi:sulfite exporter TauE/SafE
MDFAGLQGLAQQASALLGGWSPGLLLPALLVGLLGSVHCLGMCGGIVTAFSSRVPAGAARPPARAARHAIAFHAGRLSTYAAGGALAGSAASATLLMGRWLPVQQVLFIAAQLMLVALGLYLLGATRILAPLEAAGGRLWLRVQPLAVRLSRPAAGVPVAFAALAGAGGPGVANVAAPAPRARRSAVLARAYASGLAWGLLPCGMVYAMFATAMLAGSAAGGAAVMLAFGLGTVPMLLAAGNLLARLQQARRAPLVRALAGIAVIAFGVFGLLRAADPSGVLDTSLLCHTPDSRARP